MRVFLKDKQKEAVENLSNGKILCGGVGSGKSITSLAYYFTKVCNGIIKDDGEVILPTSSIPLYIITTAKKRNSLDWEREISRYGLSTEENSIIKVVIDSWNNIKKYSEKYGCFFIFDEQHVVGKGSWVKSFLRIAKRNKWILLSATPGDSWIEYVPVFIANGFYNSRHEFEEKHVVYNRYSKYPKIDEYRGTAALVSLKNKILIPLEIQRSTLRHDVYIDTNYDKELYNFIRDKHCVYDNGKPVPLKTNTEYCLALRKVSNIDVSKIQVLNSIFLGKRKLIIFYSFNYELDILKEWASSNNILFSEYNGQKHQDCPIGEEWVYLVQYISGCEAWECFTTDTIVFFSPNYSFKIIEQCKGRIDRINTTYTDLYYYHLVSNSGIDKAIKRANYRKKVFNEYNFVRAKNTPYYGGE